MLYSVSVVIPQEQSAAGGLFQVMTSLASAIGLVFSSIVANAHTSTEEPDKSFRYGFWVSVAYGLFAVVAAIPLLWGIGVVSFRAYIASPSEADIFSRPHSSTRRERRLALRPSSLTTTRRSCSTSTPSSRFRFKRVLASFCTAGK